MKDIEDFESFAAVVRAAMLASSAQSQLARALFVCAAERLQAGGLQIHETDNARLISEAVREALIGAGEEFEHGAFVSFECFGADAVEAVVRIVLDRIRKDGGLFDGDGPHIPA